MHISIRFRKIDHEALLANACKNNNDCRRARDAIIRNTSGMVIPASSASCTTGVVSVRILSHRLRHYLSLAKHNNVPTSHLESAN